MFNNNVIKDTSIAHLTQDGWETRPKKLFPNHKIILTLGVYMEDGKTRGVHGRQKTAKPKVSGNYKRKKTHTEYDTSQITMEKQVVKRCGLSKTNTTAVSHMETLSYKIICEGKGGSQLLMVA